jgi:hypothetical protein
MIGDAAQHIGEPGLGIDAVELGSGNQRIDCGCVLAAAIGTGQQPCPAPQGNTAQCALSGFVRQADAPVVKKAGGGRPAPEHVIHRFGDVSVP